MKAFVILFIVSIAAGATAQTTKGPVEPAGIQILRVELQHTTARTPTMRAVPATDPASQAQQRADRLRDVDSNPALHRLSKDAEIANTTSPDPVGNLPAGGRIIFIAAMLVKNIGTKAVTAVQWEYLQFETGAKEPVRRYQIHTRRLIPPGEQAELTKEVEPKGKEHQAMITRIEYADGSSWQPQ